jgi:hypothetical protein
VGSFSVVFSISAAGGADGAGGRLGRGARLEAGFMIARVGNGVVTGIGEPPGTGGADGVEVSGADGGAEGDADGGASGIDAGGRIGTVFAVSALRSAGSPAAFFVSGAGGGGTGSTASGAMGPVVSGGGTGVAAGGVGTGGALGLGGIVAEDEALLREGIGSVRFWSARASAVRDIFLVAWASGAVVLTLFEAVMPLEGLTGAEGERGPSGLVFAASASALAGVEAWFGSAARDGRWETPGAASGARFGSAGVSPGGSSLTKTASGSGGGAGAGGGGSFPMSSLTSIHAGEPSSRALSVIDSRPSATYSRICFSEYGPSSMPASWM